jgi:hypothetical protein
MGDMSLDTSEKTQPRLSWRMRIIAISLTAALFIALGTWFAVSRTAGSDSSDLLHLDKQRAILDNSMNLYGPLVNKFSTRYLDLYLEEASDEAKQKVYDQETERLKRESRVNLNRLERMASSPALQRQEVASAFNEFKREYGAVIAYNDQLVINLTNINRSIGGVCTSLHSMNFGAEKYAEEYVKSADGCLAALLSAKDGSDQETTKLLSDVEAVIQKQRDSAQRVIDSKDAFERSIKSTLSVLDLLEINKPLSDADTRYDADVKAKYTELIEKANKSNTELERILKDSLEPVGAETKREG